MVKEKLTKEEEIAKAKREGQILGHAIGITMTAIAKMKVEQDKRKQEK